jgi:hypothetical protein
MLVQPSKGPGLMSGAGFGCLEPSFQLFDISFLLLLVLYVF